MYVLAYSAVLFPFNGYLLERLPFSVNWKVSSSKGLPWQVKQWFNTLQSTVHKDDSLIQVPHNVRFAHLFVFVSQNWKLF